MWNCKADKKHCAHLFRDGYVGIRLSKKRNPEYPRIIRTFNNPNGKNFYNFDLERIFRQIIEEGVDRRLLPKLKELAKKGVDEI